MVKHHPVIPAHMMRSSYGICWSYREVFIFGLFFVAIKLFFTNNNKIILIESLQQQKQQEESKAEKEKSKERVK